METRTWARNTVIVSALIWLGMLLGVSFLATPAKFLAPSLTLPVALDVGRQTFGIFSIVEIFASGVLLVTAVWSRPRSRVMILAAVAGCLVAGQVVWLMPMLDRRVEVILQGSAPGQSSLHSIYIVIESVKLLLLGLITWFAYEESRDSLRHPIG